MNGEKVWVCARVCVCVSERETLIQMRQWLTNCPKFTFPRSDWTFEILVSHL